MSIEFLEDDALQFAPTRAAADQAGANVLAP